MMVPLASKPARVRGRESFLFSASDRAFFRSVSLMLWAERSPVTAESAERFSVLRPLVFRLYMFTCPVSSDMFMAGLPNSRPVPASKKAIPLACGMMISEALRMSVSTSTA